MPCALWRVQKASCGVSDSIVTEGVDVTGLHGGRIATQLTAVTSTPKMGSCKPLSSLQIAILEIASEGRARRAAGEIEHYAEDGRDFDVCEYANPARYRWHEDVDVYSAQLLHRVWSFEGKRPWSRARLRFGHGCPCGPIFDPNAIGRARYNAAKASLSRALRRLEQRALVVVLQASISHWTGIAITDAGREALVRAARKKGRPSKKVETGSTISRRQIDAEKVRAPLAALPQVFA